ncbi:MAG: hypothetical protein H6654_05260 [Ardenticatenaceae bacterium]|nr:hypothetical protein [Anaerolineales bacterium]MCB8941833.1 hypothetical protein [Ardenticatenaceae bacterium]MCB8972947.1 hypothetical protein [Ardenticatenaceae bacterium]
MIRSRLIFVLLFLAYLGVTPAGVYTCACLVAAESVGQQGSLDEMSVQVVAADTAVATLLIFFSLNFVIAGVALLKKRQQPNRRLTVFWLPLTLFCEPPPTPPPYFS